MSGLGANKNRSCTDILCLILFLLFWVGFIIVAVVAFHSGDVSRLLRGTDYAGNVCGAEGYPNQPNDTYLLTIDNNATWSQRKYIWYPITPAETQISSVLRLGVCVSKCPDGPNLGVDGLDLTKPETYEQYASRIPNITGYATPKNAERTFPVLYASTPVLNRCVPKAGEKIVKSLSEAVVDWAPMQEVGDFVWRQTAELVAAWRVLVICAVAALVVGFLWIIVLRFAVGPVVYLTLLLVLGAIGALGWVVWWRASELGDADDENSKKYELPLKITAGVIWAIGVLYICLLIFLWRHIRNAIEIIEMACRVLASLRTLPLVPPVFFILSAGVVFWCVAVAAYLQTSSQLKTESLKWPSIGDIDDHAEEYQAVVFNHPRSRDYLMLYDVFGFLWTLAFLKAACFMVIAYCGVAWYFSAPGDDKSVPHFCVLRGFWIVLRYHIGTLAFGSLIIAIIQFIRFLLSRLQKRLKRAGGHDPVTAIAKCLLACVQCCLACWERVIEYVNMNAYIMTTIDGSSFLPAAWKAIKLLIDNAVCIAAVSFIGQWVFILSKLLITGGVVVLGWVLLTRTDLVPDASTETIVLPLIIIGFYAFVIASLFVHILEALCDTLVLAFCYDLSYHNGHDKPYFMTSDLCHIMNKRNADPKDGTVPPSPYAPQNPAHINVTPVPVTPMPTGPAPSAPPYPVSSPYPGTPVAADQMQPTNKGYDNVWAPQAYHPSPGQGIYPSAP